MGDFSLDGVNEATESYLRGKKLLNNNVVHYPYEKTLGANYYVVKYIPRAIDYGLIDNIDMVI